jgi:hypothetical protein
LTGEHRPGTEQRILRKISVSIYIESNENLLLISIAKRYSKNFNFKLTLSHMAYEVLFMIWQGGQLALKDNISECKDDSGG